MIIYVESPFQISILESSLMVFTLETFRTEDGRAIYHYQLAIPAQYWTSFSRLFFDIQNCHYFSPFQQTRYENAENLLFFYDFADQSWNLPKFDVPPFRSDVLDSCYLPPINPRQISPREATDKEIMYNFSHTIASTQRYTFIADLLMQSRDEYMNFLSMWIETRQKNEKEVKIYLKDHFSLDFNQVSHIIQNINFHTISLPQYRNMQKVVIILQKYSFPCHLEVLLADPLLSGLFCHGLNRISASFDLLILEYEFPTRLLDNPKSQINKLLAEINQRFQLQVQFLAIHHEYRFYSEHMLHRRSMKMDGFSHLVFSKNKGTLLNPYHIHYNFVKKKISSSYSPPVYCDPAWKWPFWQMIGYPIEIGIILKILPTNRNLVINFLMQFPIGKIYVHASPTNESEVTIIALLRSVKNVLIMLIFLSDYFNKEKIRSYISLLTDYAIIQNNVISNLISQTLVFEFLRTSAGDFLEIPLNINERRFSLQERVELYNILKETLPKDLTTRGWRVFCDKLSKIENLCINREKIKQLISETLQEDQNDG